MNTAESTGVSILAGARQEADRVTLLVRVGGVKLSESGIVLLLWLSRYVQPWSRRPLATTTAPIGLVAARQ